VEGAKGEQSDRKVLDELDERKRITSGAGGWWRRGSKGEERDWQGSPYLQVLIILRY